MKHALFAGQTYYPRGGWRDFYGKFDTLDTARLIGEKLQNLGDCDWFQIVNLETNTIVYADKRGD